MKQSWFMTLGVAAAIALCACSGTPAAPTAVPVAPTEPPAAATTAPQPTAPAASATVAPTTAPTTAPTVAPTLVAATPTATPAASTAAETAATATPGKAATVNTPVAGGPDVSDADIQKVANAWSGLKSFRVKTELEKGTQFVGEFVAPDRSHVTIGANGQNIEFIEIGKDSYTKMGKTWTKSTGTDTGSSMTFDPKQIVTEFNDSKKDGQKLTKGATETVNGAKCQEWVITDTDGTTSSLCIGLDDWLPHQAKSSDGDQVFDFYDFNAPIKIEAPI
ncbi:MAG TPA: hypothetical protein VFZ25_09485 [Chloroflexota bacterium]|nr:hypothetical protein [Chloroflexota bacterium]